MRKFECKGCGAWCVLTTTLNYKPNMCFRAEEDWQEVKEKAAEVERPANGEKALPDWCKGEMKTCGECKYYNAEEFHCEQFECMATSYDSCPDYEKKPKNPTVFDHITKNIETLAEKLVYLVVYECGGWWYSTILPDEDFNTKEEAIAATIEEMKKEYKKNEQT